MNRRHAFTLVELIIALSASSVLMVLAIGLVHRSMSASSLAKGRADDQQTLVRLSNQFRKDVHASSAAELSDSNQLRLQRPQGHSIDYAIDGSRCQREESLENGRRHRETYRLNQDSQLAFSQLSDPERVTLVVTRQWRGRREPALVDAHVEAVVGGRLTLQSEQETNR